jgi:hypothetical protein
MQKPGFFGMNGFLLFLLTCCPFLLQAQQGSSFILIDAESKSPFTVRIGDQLYASSGHGHLVIDHLKDSSYKLGVRFPKKTLAEQVFPVVVKQKDQGFELQGSDNAWVLYNWQTKLSIHPVKDRDNSRVLEMGTKREDGFSKLMAAVVNDSAVTYNTYTGNWFRKDSTGLVASIKSSDTTTSKLIQQPIANQSVAAPNGSSAQNPPKRNAGNLAAFKMPDTVVNKNAKAPATQSPAKNPDTAMGKIAKAPATQLPIKMPDTVVGKIAKAPSTNNPLASGVQTASRSAVQPEIKKLREVNLKISRKMVFLDMGPDGLKDTVTLFVFFETGETAKKMGQDLSVVKKKTAITDSAEITKSQVKTAGADVIVPGCGEQATAADLEWLRSAILKANTEQDKINAASAAFALKCFSVSQLRVLASLLVSDKARYRLMEAAHLHVSDRDHFRELADMYTDKNFQRKFLVMADKRS